MLASPSKSTIQIPTPAGYTTSAQCKARAFAVNFRPADSRGIRVLGPSESVISGPCSRQQTAGCRLVVGQIDNGRRSSAAAIVANLRGPKEEGGARTAEGRQKGRAAEELKRKNRSLAGVRSKTK